jgi:hypothetical protein
MASLKTVEFSFPTLTSVTNNTLTNFTQTSIFLPDITSAANIRKVWVEITADDIITATGGSTTTKTIELRLGAAAYTSTTNSNAIANTAENITWGFAREFTSHFTTNWTGTSMTCDVRLQINQSTGTTLGLVNVTCVLKVTYEYDDTVTTQIKTVWIPLDAPSGSLPTVKTSHDTIPVLDTYLPETSKTYRNISIITQANRSHWNSTNYTVTYELSSLGTTTTQNYVGALLSDVWTRYVWDITTYITTNTTHTFNVWASSDARYLPMQAWMVVTYEYNASTSTSIMNSLILPQEVDSPMGTSTTNFQRSVTEFFVQESNPIRQRLGFYLFWQSTSTTSGLSARIGTGSFISYSVTGSTTVCGGRGLMVRNDSPGGVSFVRGRNTLLMDCSASSSSQRGGNVGGYWVINYTSDKHSGGVGKHNHTVIYPMFIQGTEAAAQTYTITGIAPIIPETDYFINSLGYHLNFMQGAAHQGVSIKVERLPTEGGLIFERVYGDISQHDGELGIYDIYSTDTSIFNRWPDDGDLTRVNIETDRRYVLHSSNQSIVPNLLNMMLTYHSILYTITGSISKTNGTSVQLTLHRANTDEIVKSSSRIGNGSYSFSWYDNTEDVYVNAYENNTHKGRSANGLAI